MKRDLSIILTFLMCVCLLGVNIFADDDGNNNTVAYSLDDFNALTEPVTADTVIVDVGELSLADSDKTIGNDKISDQYYAIHNNDARYSEVKIGDTIENFSTYAEEGKESVNVGKVKVVSEADGSYKWKVDTQLKGYTLIIKGHIIGNKKAMNVNSAGPSNKTINVLKLNIPDACDVVFDGVSIDDGFALYGSHITEWREDKKEYHTVESITFRNCTFNGIWQQNATLLHTSSLLIDNCTFNNYINTDAPNDSNPIWFSTLENTDVTISNSKFISSRPVKVVEGRCTSNVTIKNNKFFMGKSNSANKENEYKNVALMFSTLGKDESENNVYMKNIVVSNNEVNNAVGLFTFYKENTTKYVADGYSFSGEGNKLNNGAKLYVDWKKNEGTIPEFVKVSAESIAKPSIEETKTEIAQKVEEFKPQLDQTKLEEAVSTIQTLSTTDEELSKKIKEEISKGTEVKMVLNVDEIKSENKEHENEIKKELDGNTIGQLFDITLEVHVGDGDNSKKANVTVMEKPVEIELTVPDNLLNKDSNYTRTYTVLRYHDGTVDECDTSSLSDSNTITFSTNKFSTYALVYKDTIKETKKDNNTSSSVKKAGDKDLNSDGVVTCDEEMNDKNWVWSEAKKTCVYKVSNTKTR